jgi:hypothetical protein
MAKASQNRWPLAIGLAVLAVVAIVITMASSKDPATPTEPVAAGSSPTHNASEESSLPPLPGAHTPK